MSENGIIFYGLSTCMWCKKTKKFLDEKGIEYTHIWVNELEGDERSKVNEKVAELNPRKSFPTVCIGKTVVVGYEVEKLEEALDIWQAKKKRDG